VTKNATGDIDAASRAKGQREIASDGPEHRAKHLDGGPARGASSLRVISTARSWQDNAVEGRKSLMKILQSTAGKDACCRDVPKPLPQVVDKSGMLRELDLPSMLNLGALIDPQD
jgi:hypothetical protein